MQPVGLACDAGLPKVNLRWWWAVKYLSAAVWKAKLLRAAVKQRPEFSFEANKGANVTEPMSQLAEGAINYSVGCAGLRGANRIKRSTSCVKPQKACWRRATVTHNSSSDV